jgi:hypothetical protein
VAAARGPQVFLRAEGAQHMEPLFRPDVQRAALEQLARWL